MTTIKKIISITFTSAWLGGSLVNYVLHYGEKRFYTIDIAQITAMFGVIATAWIMGYLFNAGEK